MRINICNDNCQNPLTIIIADDIIKKINIFKGCDEECHAEEVSESQRLVRADNGRRMYSHFRAGEVNTDLVCSLFRVCCVSAKGLVRA